MEPTQPNPHRVCFLSDNSETVELVSAHLAGAGVEVLAFRDVGALTSGMGPPDRSILVLDTGVLPPEQDMALLLSRIGGADGDGPVLVCIAHSSAIGLRLQAMRAGAAAYFPTPVSPNEICERLLELSGAAKGDRYRVMVVDDQPVAALFAARVLESGGMDVQIVGEALRVLDRLEAFRPDLVLMDLRMPGADGIELTAIIREHDELYDTPVIFLSSELDTGAQMDALRVGGDDFIAKPVRPDRLIEIVRRRIGAYRSTKGRHRARQERDSITGLLSRSAFLRRVDAIISRGKNPAPGDAVLAIAIEPPGSDGNPIEPDTLDSLMGRLAGTVRRQMIEPDYAARCEDNGFAFLASRKGEGAIVDLAQTLRAELVRDARPDPVRVSIGIGFFHPPADDALTLISRAEKACTLARAADGDGVETYSPLISADSDQERDARLIEMLDAALRTEGFHLLHQPIVALRGATGERYETTLRLKSRDGEYIPAFDFLPAAQRGGLMPAIDRWVTEHALDELKMQRNAHRRLRFFVHQCMETLGAADWLSWFRDQIVARDLIKQRPILQFQLQDLTVYRDLASVRFPELRRLGIKICLNVSEGGPQAADLIGELGISLVRLPLEAAGSMETARLAGFIERVHELGAQVIVARIENPRAVARVWRGGVDFIQGNFLQLPSQDLSFDFSESALS